MTGLRHLEEKSQPNQAAGDPGILFSSQLGLPDLCAMWTLGPSWECLVLRIYCECPWYMQSRVLREQLSRGVPRFLAAGRTLGMSMGGRLSH